MGVYQVPARTMVDPRCKDRFAVLDQRAIPPDVQGLCTMTDCEYRLVEIERVLQQEFVDRGAPGIGGSTRRNTRFAIAFGIDIEAAAGKQHTLGTSQQAGNAVL